MSDSTLTEFDQFRFVRKEDGALAELRGTGRNERLFLVLDCRRYRLARLHIFEGLAARDSDAPDLFRRELEALSELQHPMLSPLISYGRDDTELFYADGVVDGELLQRYLRRTGPMPPSAALHAILDLLSVLQIEPKDTHTLSHYSTGNLFVKPATNNGVSLVFSDFSGWDEGTNEDEAEKDLDKVMRAAVTLYSMLAGQVFDSTPVIPFTREAADAPEPVKNLLKPLFVYREDGPPFKNLQDFTEAIAVTLLDLPDEEPADPPLRFFRDWLIEGLTDEFDLGPDFKLLSERGRSGRSLFGSGYTVDAATSRGLTYKKYRFHLFPNEASVPRASWMDQHRYSLRTHGRPLPNQAPVEKMLCDERFCLIGEAWIDGVNLAAIVDEMGPLPFDHAREIGQKLAAALDSMEAIASACPIWWLPPENLFAGTGSENPQSIREALDKNGIDTWKRTPLRLRLHQTGESLLKGVELPSSLIDLLQTGSKDHVDARRSAVLLPVLWFLVTGERLNWKKPLPWHDAFPLEIYNILEESRRHLVESPKEERGRILDRISSALRAKNLELEPFKAGTGPLELGKQSDRQLLPESEPESPMAAVLAGIKARRKKREPAEKPESPKGDSQPEKEDAASEAGSSPKTKKSEKSKDDTHWVKRVASQPKPVSPRLAPREEKAPAPEEDSLETPGDGFAERLIFPHVDFDGEEKATPAEGRGRDRRKKPKKHRAGSTASLPGKSRKPNQPAVLSLLILVTASALGGVVWGGMFVFNHFATTINQQVLSETFALVHYVPVTTSASEFAVPRLSHSTAQDHSQAPESASGSLPLDLSQVPEITTAVEAVDAGDKARESGQMATALAYFLRAHELDPAGVAAKVKIRGTVDDWALQDGPGIRTQFVAELVEKAAVHTQSASHLLADFYLERDHEVGLRWLQQSAESGHPRHQVILGLIFARGQLVPQELNIATRWFQRAANKGDVDGQFHFGECLILGEGITRDAPRGIDFLERAAGAGDTRAFVLLGICHAKGDGVNPNGTKAKEYFMQAADKGKVTAFYNLAVRHAKGHGAEKDEILAARIFREGAEVGSVPCMYAFGRCLETGFGIEKDLQKAKIWLTKAAHLGDVEAQAWCANNEVPFDKPAELLSER